MKCLWGNECTQYIIIYVLILYHILPIIHIYHSVFDVGTNYCQGLTIIVDDYEGHLPLTPTKESLAFGLEDFGKIHERNLYAWLGALANVYWSHFFSVFKTKTALGNAVRAQADRVNELEQEEAKDLPTLRDGSFSSVEKLYFSRDRLRGSIRPYKSENTTWTLGPHTLVKLREERTFKSKKKQIIREKRKASSLEGLDGYDSDGNDLMEGAPPSSIFGDAASPEVNGETPMRERFDGRPVRTSMKPQRFDEIHDAPGVPKKRVKSATKVTPATTVKPATNDIKGADARWKKNIANIQAQLKETRAELKASKASCNALQMRLEERKLAELSDSRNIRRLRSELRVAEAKASAGAKLGAEYKRIRKEDTAKIEALVIRIGKLEAKKEPAKGFMI